MISPTHCPICNKPNTTYYNDHYIKSKCSDHYMFVGYLLLKDFFEVAKFDDFLIQNRYCYFNNTHDYYSKIYSGTDVLDLILPMRPQESILIFGSSNYIPISQSSIKRLLNLKAFL